MLFSFAFLTAIPAHAGAEEVTVCHATGSEENPYVKLEVPLEAFISPGNSEHGHGSHEGDIYPGFQYVKKSGEIVDVPSRNWDVDVIPGMTGKYLFEVEGCEVPVETEEPEPELVVVSPVPPTYTPGTCLNPNGTVNIPEQPEGVIIPEGLPKLNENGEWYGYLFADTAKGFKFADNTDQFYYSFPVQTPTEDCTLPEMGAGDILMYAGGALLLLGLGAGAVHLSRRQGA